MRVQKIETNKPWASLNLFLIEFCHSLHLSLTGSWYKSWGSAMQGWQTRWGSSRYDYPHTEAAIWEVYKQAGHSTHCTAHKISQGSQLKKYFWIFFPLKAAPAQPEKWRELVIHRPIIQRVFWGLLKMRGKGSAGSMEIPLDTASLLQFSIQSFLQAGSGMNLMKAFWGNDGKNSKTQRLSLQSWRTKKWQSFKITWGPIFQKED